ncbi:MAG: cytochrome c oxidase accessory protein CcoG, partial [Gammaproteobacteria bacterium]|nr:cytochrome c oxidase accessory protein CcoG [Gammaproteobacteria bacterium]
MNAPVNDAVIQQSLFEKHQKIYPREVHGRFARLRFLSVVSLLGLFYALPWINWDGRQSILFDLPARKFYIFDLVFWPQDFLLLAFLLILAALSLFFFTTLAGRLWCGYACPQTVWTEVFLWVERMVEGDRIAQMRLDKSPMGLKKFRIKATKHAIWILFSMHTGVTFIGYFTPIRELTSDIMTMQLGAWPAFWMLFYGFATYGNAGWMREQVCKYMCPYARFQSAMFDRDTMIVSYDKNRGEPRGQRRFDDDEKRKQLGDCINCTMCVQVCPTGIDIRDGLQYECIGCSACIDVCDDVMKKVGYEPGLIRYSTQNLIDKKPSRIIRPRIIIYASILAVLVSLFIGIVATRVPLALDVIRDRNQLYRETQGLIENVYTLKIINMDDVTHKYDLSVQGIEGLKMELEYPDITVKMVPDESYEDIDAQLIQVRRAKPHFLIT